jgi:hypothetical protein
MVIGCLLSLILAIPMALIAVVIKVSSPGPIFFRQWRLGVGGRKYRVLRFRTMTVCEDGELVRRIYEPDRRVTRFGRFLRRQALDKIPTILHLATGQISLFETAASELSDTKGNDLEMARSRESIQRHVRTFFDFVAVFLPRRLSQEDVGDALERISGWSEKYRGRCFRFMVALKVASTVFFLVLNTVREIASSFSGKKRGG